MITPMHMSPAGEKKLRIREGEKLQAYRDSQGIWTIGVGHAATSGRPPIPVHGMTITQAECDQILTDDLKQHYEPLLNRVLRIQLADHEFDALLSIVFNTETFIHSTAIRLLNHGDKIGCARHIMDWRIPAEIIGRRRSEQLQFLTPYPTASLPQPTSPPPSQTPPGPSSVPQSSACALAPAVPGAS